MNTARFATFGLLVLLGACGKAATDDTDEGAGAATVASSGKVSVSTEHLETSLPIGKVDPNLPPNLADPTSCDVSGDILKVSGSQHDDAINKILLGDFQLPTTCEDPGSSDETWRVE